MFFFVKFILQYDHRLMTIKPQHVVKSFTASK
jgi:hypothetical protein